MADTTKVLFELTDLAPDPVQFKPYSPHYKPVGVFVAIEVPNEYVISSAKGKAEVILTPLGGAFCMKELATAITKIQTDPPRKR